MTEVEWLACTDPGPMLEFLKGKASDRKLRLFACACCRRIWNLLSDRFSRKALNITERFSDGEVSEEKLKFAWGDARRAAQVEHRKERTTANSAAWAVSEVCDAAIGRAVGAVWIAATCEANTIGKRYSDAQQEQLPLIRCIFGNPFSPITHDPAWLTPNVQTLAQAIYDDRAFDGMPILADALAEAGCTNPDILSHCRGPGPHVRGCLVVDLVLGKE